ncbi:Uncharacterised protein [Mycobacterium tuberculosis]|nr:Uncharacterised protein [Mycobacterium tuberculosis]
MGTGDFRCQCRPDGPLSPQVTSITETSRPLYSRTPTVSRPKRRWWSIAGVHPAPSVVPGSADQSRTHVAKPEITVMPW